MAPVALGRWQTWARCVLTQDVVALGLIIPPMDNKSGFSSKMPDFSPNFLFGFKV
jgi:hypothetical protein